MARGPCVFCGFERGVHYTSPVELLVSGGNNLLKTNSQNSEKILLEDCFFFFGGGGIKLDFQGLCNMYG